MSGPHWILELDPDAGATGPRLAVKDAIDVAGVPTTVGCAAIADAAEPAAADAPCVATARAAGARIVGKANLHELCFGTHGGNPWYGDAVNPLDPERLVGGSSSGSAVAVAIREADIGYGTDTGGSVRLPAACCGLVGLKTTFGRIPTEGVWPLSVSLDTVGPIARTVGDVVTGMQLLEPGFSVEGVEPGTVVGRVRIDGLAEPELEAAVDAALAAAGLEVVEVTLPGWNDAGMPFGVILLSEAWEADRALYERAPERIGAESRSRLEIGRGIDAAQLPVARAAQQAWTDEVAALFAEGRVQVLAMPTMPGLPPGLDAEGVVNSLVSPWNVAGVPALALPIPVAGWTGGLPGSLQLIGPRGGEELLCATGSVVEAAVLA